ncbi:uncharacterized protein LOC117892361 [Drosophila subobscura]|uniref:uncharacterized protein LOC117892361 n=1 Tax=Drosophila subobscura TaxID=7241 RepID=UPI00155A369E|nr:uncharacterized protein LOC117892361 [Drosophila subobscura]
MRLVQKMLTKMSRLSGSNSLRCATMRHQIGARLKRRPTVADRRFAQNMNEEVKKPGSALVSMREFFMHPQTWDRNNGYFNVVLALSIFGFCFFNSCCPSEEKVATTDKLPVPPKK